MWLLLILMTGFLILDKTGVLKCNTLFMSIVYIIGIPVMLCTYLAITLSALINVVVDFSLGSCIMLAINLMLALPSLIFLIYILLKICRSPIDRSRFNGSDEDYNIACMKRQRTILWVVYPLFWVSIVIALGIGLHILVTVIGASLLAMNPAFWLISLLTLGIALACYVIAVAGYMSVSVVVFLLFSVMAGIFVIITVAMTATALYRMRKLSGYSIMKNVVTVVSMLIPVWSLITMIELSVKMRKISKKEEYVVL